MSRFLQNRHVASLVSGLGLFGLCGVSLVGAQSPPQTSSQPPTPILVRQLLAEGRTGQAIEEWKRLPASADTARLGVDVGIAARRFDIGVQSYLSLRAALKQDENTTLRILAVGVAEAGTQPNQDPEVPIRSCIVLLDDAAHAKPCRAQLEALVNDLSRVSYLRGIAAFGLLEHEVPEPPGYDSYVTANMPSSARGSLASEFINLPAAMRVALARPLVESDQFGDKVQGAMLLADIGGPEAIAALEGATWPGMTQGLLHLALAACGQEPAFSEVAANEAHLIGQDPLYFALGLARRHDPRGVTLLERAAQTGMDVERLHALELLVPLAPARAIIVARNQMPTVATAMRERFLRAIVPLGVGRDTAVINWLADPDERVRVAASRAVLAVR
jgi:hypothetical protein